MKKAVLGMVGVVAILGMMAGVEALGTTTRIIGQASNTYDGYVMIVSSRCTEEKVDEYTAEESIENYKKKGIYLTECKISL